MLLMHGARVDPMSRVGLTPLARAIRDCRDGCVRALLDHGALLSNVKDAVVIPPWVHALSAGRTRCRAQVLLLIGLRRCCRSALLMNGGRDVTTLLARAVWATRFDLAWQEDARRS